VSKTYNQYCPIAHALDLVGERWSLLIVRELLAFGPLRYSDLHCRLEHCGTNILASRLKDLERGGVLRRRRLPPPAAATVYELTEYGEGLRAVMHQLAHWGARSLDPPSASEELAPGWLTGALRTALPPDASVACIEFRIGDEIATWAPGDIRAGSSEHPDVIVEGDPADLFHFFVDRDDRGLTVRGDRAVVTRLLERMPVPVPRPSPTEPEPAAA
jgi:DNA-binding HxlR family transcriptional regulator